MMFDQCKIFIINNVILMKKHWKFSGKMHWKFSDYNGVDGKWVITGQCFFVKKYLPVLKDICRY